MIKKLIDIISATLIVAIIITILLLIPIIAMVFGVFLAIGGIFIVIQDHRGHSKKD